MITKRTSRDGKKQYSYEYKNLLLRPEVVDLFKQKAKEANANFSDYLQMLLKKVK